MSTKTLQQIDGIVAQAAQRYIEKQKATFAERTEFLKHDLDDSFVQVASAAAGRDFFEDRVCFPVLHSLNFAVQSAANQLPWIREFVSNSVAQRNSDVLTFVDTKPRSGANLLSLATALVESQVRHPIRIVAIEPNPFAASYLQILGQTLLSTMQLHNVEITIKQQHWSAVDARVFDGCVVITEAQQFAESAGAKKVSLFNRLLQMMKPKNMAIVCDCDAVIKQHLQTDLTTMQYQVEEVEPFNLPTENYHPQCQQLLNTWNTKNVSIVAPQSEIEPVLFATSNEFTLGSLRQVEEQREQSILDTSLFKNIREFSEKQTTILKTNHWPLSIEGSAGSGKTIVLIQKLYDTIEKAKNGSRILFSTFNKRMIQYVDEVLESRLKASGFSRTMHGHEGVVVTFEHEDRDICVRLIHFDYLPVTHGQIKYGRVGNVLVDDDSPEFRSFMNRVIEDYCVENNVNQRRYRRYLNPRVIWEEYERLYYGEQIHSLEEFQVCKRPGRPRLNKNNEVREIIWGVIQEFLKQLDNRCGKDNWLETVTFYSARQCLIDALERGEISPYYDAVFIDEAQDCLYADFLIFDLLLKDKNKKFYVGDTTQALHTGKSSLGHIPKLSSTKRRLSFKMNTTFRMSKNLVKALQTLHNYMYEKGRTRQEHLIYAQNALDGVRPVVLFEPNVQQAAQKISLLFSTVCEPHAQSDSLEKTISHRRLAVMESDEELFKALNTHGLKDEIVDSSITRQKGREFDCVVWSVRKPFVGDEHDYLYSAYTVLTRPKTMCIIWCSSKPSDRFVDMMRRIEEPNLLFYDRASQDWFEEYM